MTDKLGFTFYPKDWWTSDTFLELDFFERAVFLECIFMMYSDDGYMNCKKSHFEKRHRISITDEQWNNVVSNFIVHDGKFTLPSVNKRLKRAVASQQNGGLGGRPKGKKKEEKNNLENLDEKPRKPSFETYNNLPSMNRIDVIKTSSEVDVNQHRFYTIHEFEKIEIEGTQMALLAMRRSGKKAEEIPALFLEFIELKKAVKNLTWQSEADARTHFLNWAGKQKNNSTQSRFVI